MIEEEMLIKIIYLCPYTEKVDFHCFHFEVQLIITNIETDMNAVLMTIENLCCFFPLRKFTNFLEEMKL